MDHELLCSPCLTALFSTGGYMTPLIVHWPEGSAPTTYFNVFTVDKIVETGSEVEDTSLGFRFGIVARTFIKGEPMCLPHAAVAVRRDV